MHLEVCNEISHQKKEKLLVKIFATNVEKQMNHKLIHVAQNIIRITPNEHRTKLIKSKKYK